MYLNSGLPVKLCNCLYKSKFMQSTIIAILVISQGGFFFSNLAGIDCFQREKKGRIETINQDTASNITILLSLLSEFLNGTQGGIQV